VTAVLQQVTDQSHQAGIANVTDNGFVQSLGWAPNGLTLNDSVVLGFSANISNMVGINLCTPMAGLTSKNSTEAFFNTSRSTYLYYQALLAKALYIDMSQYSQNGTYWVLTYRLVADERASHALSALCGATGLILLLVFVGHHRRKTVQLACEPSGIATTAAMLSSSSFPEKLALRPKDDANDLKNKLGKVRFMLDGEGRVDMV